MSQNRKIIVSCTTTFERLHMFYYASQSLLKQTLKPDIILVNISREPYLMDSGIKDIPDWLEQRGFKLNFVKNIGPYRKLIPAIDLAYNDDVIITVDDDVIYSNKWLEQLMDVADDNLDFIVCSRARIMKKNFFQNWQNYNNWTVILSETKGLMILPNGAGGVVYRKKLLDLEFLKDESFLKLVSTTDDLWFRMASLIKKIPVLVFPEIDKDNLYFQHKLGLEEKNMCRILVNKSLFFKIINKFYLLFADYIGINQYLNDKNWDLIVKYSEIRKLTK